MKDSLFQRRRLQGAGEEGEGWSNWLVWNLLPLSCAGFHVLRGTHRGGGVVSLYLILTKGLLKSRRHLLGTKWLWLR